MPKTKPFARVAITLPEKDLLAADRLAHSLDRSRSWVIAEAIRRYAAAAATPAIRVPTSGRYAVSAPTASRHGLGESRLAQLVSDMALTPEERIRAAEETLRMSERQETPRAHTVRAFDRYLDYLDWKRTRDPGR